jgi:hypothetical protein
MIDGGPGAEPAGRIDAWLVTDERAELIGKMRAMAREREAAPRAESFRRKGLRVEPKPVVHTNHPTFGFLIRARRRTAAWAPEFLEFPDWAAGVDLLFAEAAGWNRSIRFAGGVGGHLHALAVAAEAERRGVRRLVFAHIGRPTIRAIGAGQRPPFGEFARDGQIFTLR